MEDGLIVKVMMKALPLIILVIIYIKKFERQVKRTGFDGMWVEENRKNRKWKICYQKKKNVDL